MDFQLEKNIPLSQHTTLKLGGVADLFATVRNEDELIAALRFAKQTATPLFILGGGSNILFSDEGFRGMVIKSEIKGIEYKEKDKEDVILEAGSGEILDKVIENTIKYSYWGLENLTSIPGTVGAVPVQNVGAYGVEVSSLIESVEAINVKTSKKKIFKNDECKFSYRDSYFKTKAGQDWFITKVKFNLSKSPNPKIDYADLAFLKESKNINQSIIREALSVIRSGKFPDWTRVGTAGSFFKNPVISNGHFQKLKETYPELPGFETEDGIKVSLGWILDKVCNLKGHCDGNVCLYKKQALVLVNNGNSSKDVKKFVKKISDIVKEKTEIEIFAEVKIL